MNRTANLWNSLSRQQRQEVCKYVVKQGPRPEFFDLYGILDIVRLQDYVKSLQMRTSQSYMLYDLPNGGHRILPSVYTKLNDRWLRANRQFQTVASMNQGHINACINLLNESHINLLDKINVILGKIHAHLNNQPNLQSQVVELAKGIEKLNVDDFYPIVRILAEHLESSEFEVSDYFDIVWDEL